MQFKSYIENKMNQPYVRFIGDADLPNSQEKLIELASDAEYSICLGDIGYDYKLLHNLDYNKHKMLAGNHDEYSKDEKGNYHMQTKHFLGDYGTYKIPNFYEIFYIRGGYTRDGYNRVQNVNWFPEDEELKHSELYHATTAYRNTKPEFVISHEAPKDLIKYFINSSNIDKTKTSQALQSMFEIHSPKFWFLGHYHNTKSITINGTYFQCLAQLDYYDF